MPKLQGTGRCFLKLINWKESINGLHAAWEEGFERGLSPKPQQDLLQGTCL